ncbi:MAG: hypothetical protein FWG98_01155 [Candidatus Cloacimonetes bacterium]|nr:hypothetical protein [Candidatus Cloacimonadota bacterium]
MMEAKYEIAEITKEYIYIIDTGNHTKVMTVTNDADNVVKNITKNNGKEGYLPQRIFYKDSDGFIDEIGHNCTGKC